MTGLSVPKLIQRAFISAKTARGKAYAPYSKFRVGSTLVASSGKLISGANIENVSYGGTICAERVAIFHAVSKGERTFSDIVVVTASAHGEPAYPCALCLQVMAEFFSPDSRIWVADTRAVRAVHRFSDLLPYPFGPKQLRQV